MKRPINPDRGDRSEEGRIYYYKNRETILLKRRTKEFREKQNAWNRKRRIANGDEIRAKEAAYKAINRDAVRRWNRDWCKANRAKRVAYFNEWKKKPHAKASKAACNRVWHALRGSYRADKTHRMLGCSPRELVGHLERQFLPGMTWENYGSVWEVDHIKACAEFDLKDPLQQLACFNFKNLQPLFTRENRQKGAYLGLNHRWGFVKS